MRVLVLLAIVGCAQPAEHDSACTDVFYADVDGDGHGDALATATACSAPSGYTTTSDDCDDDRATVHPGADEICNEVDDDCDLAVDEDAIDALVWYTDADADGFGDAAAVTNACSPAGDQVAVAGDCADGDAAVNPDADELCNDVDDDCDGLVDSEDPSLAQGTVWYADADGDAYGDATTGAHACEAPAGRTTDSSDCDDTDGAVHPNADEICNDGDDDCDGLVDIDDDSLVDPVLPFYADVDGDGWGSRSEVIEDCAAPSGYVATGGRREGDCDDTDPAVGPALDYYGDTDGDGYGFGLIAHTCSPSADWVLVEGDCNPDDPDINPGAPEVCDSVDNNCDRLVDEDDPLVVPTTYYADDDGDGFGDATDSVASCGSVTGYVEDSSDCADDDATIHPGVSEYCDGIDNDCDGATDVSVVYVDWYADADGDGYGDADVVRNDCAQPSGYVLAAGDCDDGSATTNPGAIEACANGADDDCDGAVDNCQLASDDADVLVKGDGWWWGNAVETADTDGDGVSDLVVTALYGADSCGSVYVAPGPITASTTTAGMVVLSGTTTDAHFGAAVDGGDEDGDGVDDVLVGANEDDAAYLFLGPVTADRDDAHADAVFEGDVRTNAGYDVDVIPDFDGNGAPDLAIGAPDVSVPGDDRYLWRGDVYIVSGPASGNIDLVSDATYTYEGRGRQSYLGLATASAGDVNGDGIDDLAMSDADGYVYLVDGGATPGTYTAHTAASASVNGSYFRETASVDYDGDGSLDLLVGAPGIGISGDSYVGAVYGFLGPLSGSLRTSDAAVSWNGDADVEVLGADVAAGDVDGDKEPDVIMGAQFAGAPFGSFEGAVFLQLGLASGAVDVGTLLSVRGNTGEQIGHSIAMIPDWSGDDADEVAIATLYYFDRHSRETVGAVYVFFSDGLAL